MATHTFAVDGLTCPTCLALVLERVRSVAGVGAVGAELVHGRPSRVIVRTTAPVDVVAVRAAVEDAGFPLIAPAAHEHPTPPVPSAVDASWFTADGDAPVA